MSQSSPAPILTSRQFAYLRRNHVFARRLSLVNSMRVYHFTISWRYFCAKFLCTLGSLCAPGLLFCHCFCKSFANPEPSETLPRKNTRKHAFPRKNTWKHVETRGNTRKNVGNTRKHVKIRENTWKHVKTRENYEETWGNYNKTRRNTRSTLNFYLWASYEGL